MLSGIGAMTFSSWRALVCTNARHFKRWLPPASLLTHAEPQHPQHHSDSSVQCTRVLSQTTQPVCSRSLQVGVSSYFVVNYSNPKGKQSPSQSQTVETSPGEPLRKEADR